MHDLMGRTRYAKYHGWRGRRDFCEAPSQLLEFFCWLPQTLKLMSCHYSYLSEEYKQQWERMDPAAAKQPEKQIPDEMLSALIAAKNVNSAIWTARQVGLSIFDMKVHNPSSHEELEGLDIAKCINFYDCTVWRTRLNILRNAGVCLMKLKVSVRRSREHIKVGKIKLVTSRISISWGAMMSS